MTSTFLMKNGDFVKNTFNTGYVMVEGRNKVMQDCRMVLSTDIRESTGIGCSLDELIGEDSENPAAPYAMSPIMFKFQMRVNGGLNALRAAQRRYLFSQRGSEELINRISPVEIWPDSEDPRNFRWRVFVTTIEGKSSFYVNGRT